MMVYRMNRMMIYKNSDIVKLYNHELQVYSDPSALKWLEDMAYRMVMNVLLIVMISLIQKQQLVPRMIMRLFNCAFISSIDCFFFFCIDSVCLINSNYRIHLITNISKY